MIAGESSIMFKSNRFTAVVAAITVCIPAVLQAADDWTGYAPSCIPASAATVNIGKNSIRHGDMLISFGDNKSWYSGLAWSLSIRGRTISKRFGPHFRLAGKYTVAKRLLQRTIHPTPEGDGLMLEAKLVLADGEPFMFRSWIRIINHRIHYTASTTMKCGRQDGMAIDLAIADRIFAVDHCLVDGRRTSLKLLSIAADLNIAKGETLSLTRLRGDQHLLLNSPGNNMRATFFCRGPRHGEISIMLHADNEHPDRFAVVLDAGELLADLPKQHLTVPQQVMLELGDRGRNLLLNSSFEFGNRYLTVSGWQSRSWIYRKNPSLDFSIEDVWSIADDEARYGARSLKMTCPPGFSMAQIGFYACPVRTGRNYVVSFYAKSTSRARIQVFVFGAAGHRDNLPFGQSYAEKGFSLGPDWTRHKFAVKAACPFVRLAIRCDNRNEDTSRFETAWFDGIQLEEGKNASDYDNDRLRAAFVTTGNFAVWRPGEEVRLACRFTGRAGHSVNARFSLLTPEGDMIADFARTTTLDQSGQACVYQSCGTLARGVYGITVTAVNNNDIARDHYRINVLDRLSGYFRNRYLTSVSFGGGRSWKRWFDSLSTFGIHLARTWTWLPERVINRYLKAEPRPLELYGSVLAHNNNFGPLVPGRVSQWHRKAFYEHVPFVLSDDFQSRVRGSMRYYLRQYGQITEFLWIMNEPNAPDWAIYRKGGRREGVRPELAARITRWAWEERNRIDPNLPLSGPATYNIDLEWFERYLNAGAGKYLDYFDFHCYNWNPEQYMDERVKKLKILLRKHNLSHLRLMCSEMGLYVPYDIPELGQMTNRLSASKFFIDYRPGTSELFMAGMLARNLLLALKHDLFTCTYFNYDATGPGNLVMDRDFTPTMHIAAMNHFNHEFGNMRYDSEISFDTYTRALIFTGDSIDRHHQDMARAAIWSTLKDVSTGAMQPSRLVFPPAAMTGISLEVSDVIGRSLPAPGAKGLRVGIPLYLAARQGDGYLGGEALRKLLDAAELQGAHGYTIRSRVEFLPDAIRVTQQSRRKENGICRLTAEPPFPFTFAPQSWNHSRNFAADFTPFSLAKLEPFRQYAFTLTNRLEGQQTSRSMRRSFYLCRSRERDVSLIPLSSRKTFKPDAWTGTADFSAAISMQWDTRNEGHLFIDIKVVDESFSPPPANTLPGAFWKYDSLTLYFDTKADGFAAEPHSGLDTNDYRYDIAIQKDKPVIYRAANPQHQECFLYAKQLDNAVTCTFSRTGNGYCYRIVIPQTRILSFRIGKGKILRFALFLSDNDGNGRETGLTTTPTETDPHDSPNLWTTVLLAP